MTIVAIPFGLVLGVLALCMALGQFRKHQAAVTGLLLSLSSFGILFIWILTATVVFSDPTFQWSDLLSLPILE
jgi:apolipoprotein N-acyltransferase